MISNIQSNQTKQKLSNNLKGLFSLSLIGPPMTALVPIKASSNNTSLRGMFRRLLPDEIALFSDQRIITRERQKASPA